MSFKKAKRIWINNLPPINSFADFSCYFTRADKIKIACDGNYSLYINGEFVSTGQFPGYEDMLFFDEINIEKYATKEENTLLITAHHPGRDFSTYRNQPAFLIFEITLGNSIIGFSDTNTKARKNPYLASGDSVKVVSGQLGFTFEYDSTAKESEWENAIISNGNEDFLPRPIEKLNISENTSANIIARGGFCDREKYDSPAEYMQNASLTDYFLFQKIALPIENGIELSKKDCDNGIFTIIDLEKESAGFLSLDLEVPEECDIFIGWGEHLADLRVRTSVGKRNFAVKYRAHRGRNIFAYPMLRLGLRYLQLHIYSDKCKIYYAGIKRTDYPLKKAISCPINDKLHQKIYDTCVETLKLCMHEHYEDCPWREQALYTMDSRNQMLCGYYAFGETKFAAASLKLISHSLRDDGLLELCSPAKVPITIPSFSAIFIVQLYEYFKYSNDENTSRELIPTAKRIADGFISRLENNLIRCYEDKQYWNFYEWQSGLSESRTDGELSFDAPLSAFVIMALDSLSMLCKSLGDGEFEKYSTISKNMKTAVQKFWIEEKGCYASFIKDGKKHHFSELTNSLLICAHAVPTDKKDSVLNALKSEKLLKITLSHSIFRYEALLENAENREYVLSDIAEKWGYMLYQGATSFWETIDGSSAFANAGSLCHGWSAVPIYIYFKLAKQL